MLLRSLAMRSCWPLRPIASPAMNAPMMNASCAESASTASPSTITRAATVSVVPERDRREHGEQRRHGEDAHHTREHQEAERQADGRGDDADGDRVARDHLDHDGEDDQAEHVVGDGGTQHDARLDRRQRPEVTEDARRDADAGRRQRGAEEDRRLGVEAEAHAGPGADDERHGDADDGDEHRGPADPAELGEVHLHPDLDQQQQHPELGEHAEADPPLPAQLDEAEHGWPDEDAGHDLAEHRRHADPLGSFGRQLGGGDHDEEVEQQARQVDGLHQAEWLSRARDDGRGERHHVGVEAPPPAADGDHGVVAEGSSDADESGVAASRASAR